MKGLETAAIVLAAVAFVITILFKLTGFQHFVTATGVWRFTMVCLGFAIWARLCQQGPEVAKKPELPQGD